MRRFTILVLFLILALFLPSDGLFFSKSTQPLFSFPSDTYIVAIESPYQSRSHVYRGQVHSHTTNSDGRQHPREVIASYRTHGYDFVVITDHNHITSLPALKKILYIPGVENDYGCRHFNRINARLPVPFPREPKKIIHRSKEEGSYSILNHPDWPYDWSDDPCWSDEDLLSVVGYEAIEIFNASCPKQIRNSEARADFLLSRGRRIHLIASDDCHDVQRGPCFRSSVYVFSDDLTIPSLIASLKAGNFYSSTGPTISQITVTDQQIRIQLPEPAHIEFLITGGRTIQDHYNVSVAEYSVHGNEGYIRVRITRIKDGKKAWSNPFFVSRISTLSNPRL